MKRPSAMHPDCWKPYVTAMFQAGINPEFGTKPSGGKGARIMQIIGAAKASAGYHAADGSYVSGVKGIPYCAAIDIRTTDLTKEEAERLNRALIKNGFASWWRNTGSFKNNQHIHCVYLGVPMKRQLRAQAHSFFDRRSGLVGNAKEPFLQSQSNFSDSIEDKSRMLFLSKNRITGGVPASVFATTYALELPVDCECGLLDEDADGVWGDVEEPDFKVKEDSESKDD